MYQHINEVTDELYAFYSSSLLVVFQMHGYRTTEIFSRKTFTYLKYRIPIHQWNSGMDCTQAKACIEIITRTTWEYYIFHAIVFVICITYLDSTQTDVLHSLHKARKLISVMKWLPPSSKHKLYLSRTFTLIYKPHKS